MKENIEHINIEVIIEIVYKYDSRDLECVNLWNSQVSTVDAMCSRPFNYETPLLHMQNTPPTGGQEALFHFFVSPGQIPETCVGLKV